MDDPGSLRDDLREGYREVEGPPPDEIDGAIRTLTEARRLLKDKALMKAVQDRMAEQREAVEQAGKKRG